jgi:UDP-sugar pyrophosphorylase
MGLIAEFINPKYADSSRTKFKSATRLECMMQDYPKLLKAENKVGITQFDRRFCFSALKNDIQTAAQKY